MHLRVIKGDIPRIGRVALGPEEPELPVTPTRHCLFDRRMIRRPDSLHELLAGDAVALVPGKLPPERVPQLSVCESLFRILIAVLGRM